jgi:GTP cyclohydrolase I
MGAMKDVAAAEDVRGITIQRVGVKDVHLPARIRRKDGGHNSVLARIDMSVELPHQFRGTHMSRFLAILSAWGEQPIGITDLHEMLSEARSRLDARRAEAVMTFKYFLPKQAPVSQAQSALDYDCSFHGLVEDDVFVFTLGVEVPVTLLCPCSREISAHGAHNQRGVIRVSLRCPPGQFIWIEDLVPMLEAQGSSQIYALLKREDEKFVTEQAYGNPKFVEDVLRDVVAALRADQRVVWFRAECESYESIHNHSAYAMQEEARA